MSPLNAASCTTYLERQKCYGPDKKILFKKPLFDLEVKGQGPRKVIMLHDTPPYGHAAIPKILDLSQKKQLFDLKVKGQGPTKFIMVCDTPPYGHAPTYQISLTDLERNNYLTLRSKNKFPRSSLRYVTHRLMVIHSHTKYYWPISKEKNVMARTRKYHSKNIYLTFRSKGMVPRRSLWYATHRLVVMYPHIKYHWPIWKDKKVMVRTSFAEKQKKWKRK